MMRSLVAVAFVAAGVLAIAACPKSDGDKKPAVVDAGTAADPNAVIKDDAQIRATFDAATPADPRALELCKALYDLPEQKKDTCCKFPAPPLSALTATCAGLLSDALKDKNLAFDDSKAKQCVAERAKQLDGCAWVTASAPEAPPWCTDLFGGSLDDGARCRSSLECKKGLRCHGAGPLDAGRCGGPLPDGSRCGASVDGLSAVIDQRSIDRDHPQCKNICGHLKCQSIAKVGDECLSHVECGPANHCQDKKCVAGLLAVGKKCSAGGCADGLLCAMGTCQAARKDGDECGNDFDCAAGGCVKHKGQDKGVCAMKCSPFPLP